MKRNLIAAALSALLLLGATLPPAHAQQAPAKVNQPWFSLGQLGSVSVTTSSAPSQITTQGLVAWVRNTGANDAYLAFGVDNTVAAATATGTYLKTGTCAAYDLWPASGPGKPFTWLAAIGSGGSTTLVVETGIGQPPGCQSGGGGGGGGGAITAAAGSYSAGAFVAGTGVDGWDATQGTTSGTAVTTDANGTLQQYLRGLVKQIAAVFSTSGAATSWLTVWVQNAVTPGQTTMSASTPVVIASNQSVVPVGLQATPSGGWTMKTFIAANSDNATNLKNAAGTVHAVEVFGIDAAPAWLKFYNKASSPTCASDTIVKQIMIPANSTAALGAGAVVIVLDAAFSTGISYCVTKGIAVSDDTSVDAASFVVNIDYN